MIIAIIIVIAAVLAVIFFPLRLIIHAIGNSAGYIGIIIIDVITIIFAIAGLVFTVMLEFYTYRDGPDGDTLVGAGMILTPFIFCNCFCVAFGCRYAKRTL